mgnify:CR=1 FL=1
MYDFSSGFETSSSELYLFLGIVAVLILVLFLAQLRKPKPKKKKPVSEKEPILHRRPEVYVREELVLSPREQQALDRLSWCLKDPKHKDQLLENSTLFLRASRKALREGMVKESDLYRLTGRVGVSLDNLRAHRRSSSTLPAGAEASVADREMHMATGEVLLSDEDNLRIRIIKGHSSFSRGSQVEIVSSSDEGMYRFFTTVIAQEGKTVTLHHSNQVEHVQRRRYRRRRIQLPVELTLRAMNDKPLASKTVDLSVGGAAVRNPKKRYVTGSELDVTISLSSDTPMTLPATVVRTSRRGKTLHLRFGKLDTKQEYRLFRALFALGSR